MSGLKVYVDLMSQPCRAILMLLKATNIPFEQKIISIAKQENKTPEFKKIHPFGKLPAIEDGNVKMIESIAILRYLIRKNQALVPDHWYPKDLLGAAKVDEFLEWHHTGLRIPVASYFAAAFLSPMLTGKPTPPAVLEKLKVGMVESIGNVENVWLKDRPYVTGQKISIADLIGLCEIEQLLVTSYDPFADRPILTAWAERLRNELKPHYNDVHKIFYKVVEKTKNDSKL